MVDFINDYRGSDNRDHAHKHKNLYKKQKRYGIKRNKILCKRSPARSYTNDMLVFPDAGLNGADYFSDDKNESELIFNTAEDALAFEWSDSIESNFVPFRRIKILKKYIKKEVDSDQREAMRLYCVPSLSEAFINSFKDLVIHLYPIQTPLIVAASSGNDKLVRMYLSEPSLIIDVDLKFDTDMKLNKNKCPYNTYQPYGLSSGVRYYCIFDKYINCNCESCHKTIGISALWLACFNGHLNVVRTLIEIGKVDVELTNVYRVAYFLQVAIVKNHIDIVQYLVEQANESIDKGRVLFIAMQSRNYNVIDYLLTQGFDPNIPSTYLSSDDEYLIKWFALHDAIRCSHPNLSIIRTILEHGGDPTLQNDQGETALHIAIQCGNEEIIEEILHYGFKHDQRDRNDRTPLMLALENDQTDIINLMYEMLPRQQFIDEIMLLACHYVFHRSYFHPFDINSQAFIYFEQALMLQEPNSDAIPCEAYLFRKECRIIDELIIIRNNSELMYIQALLVYERLLSQRDEIHHLIPKLIDRNYAYEERREYNRCLLILTHAYSMSLLCKKNLFEHLNSQCLELLAHLLDHLIEDVQIIYKEKILQTIEWIFNELDDVIEISHLYIKVTYLIQTNRINNDDKLRLMRSIKQTIHKNTVELFYGYNFFQKLFLTRMYDLNALNFYWSSISPENVLCLLIQCGADVNKIDFNSGQRPLHQVAYAIDIEQARSMAEILIGAGAHTDCRDYRGLLPEEHAKNIEIREFLCSKRSISLKCQCAHLIISRQIKYDLYLSKNLKNFILMHRRQMSLYRPSFSFCK